MKSLCILTLCAAAMLLGACRSVPLLRYNQNYDTLGNRYDSYLMYDKGTLSPFKTPLAKLLALDKENAEKAAGFREGYFFFQSDEARARGYGIGDTLNTAAWFILNFKPQSEHYAYSKIIGEFLRRNESEKADELLAALRASVIPGGKIITIVDYHDENKRFIRSTCDRFAGKTPSGKVNPLFGLQRFYYENGLIRNEHFCIDDNMTGTVILYTPEGKIESVKEYE